MKFRHTVVLSAESIATAGTKVVDLNLGNPISRVIIMAKYTNNGSAVTAHPAAILSKIEIVDGSDVLCSMSGYEAEALAFYHNSKPSISVFSTIDNNTGTFSAIIDFGRFLYDPILALDPARFSNLQLKVTHNLAAGGSAPDAATLEVSADVFNYGAEMLQGFLMNKEIYQYTVVASATEHIVLPVDFPYRILMIQSRAADKHPHDQYNRIRLDGDNLKHLFLEDNTSDLMKVIGSLYPRYIENYRYAVTTTAVAHQVTPCYDTAFIPSTLLGTDSAHLNLTAYGGEIDLDGSAATECDAIVQGLAPHGALPIVFGDIRNLDDCLDVSKLSSLRLRLIAGANALASSTCQIVGQQFRRY